MVQAKYTLVLPHPTIPYHRSSDPPKCVGHSRVRPSSVTSRQSNNMCHVVDKHTFLYCDQHIYMSSSKKLVEDHGGDVIFVLFASKEYDTRKAFFLAWSVAITRQPRPFHYFSFPPILLSVDPFKFFLYHIVRYCWHLSLTFNSARNTIHHYWFDKTIVVTRALLSSPAWINSSFLLFSDPPPRLIDFVPYTFYVWTIALSICHHEISFQKFEWQKSVGVSVRCRLGRNRQRHE